MGISAFVLIEVEAGRVKGVALELSQLPGVELSAVVTGPYDIIGYLKKPDIESLGEMITNNIQTIGGVRKTITCLCSLSYSQEKSPGNI